MIVSKRLVEDDENVLARKVFVTLVKLYPRGYSILNDGNFVKKIYAASDEEAIRQFNELATKGKLLTESVKKVVKEQVAKAKHQTLVESVMSDLDLEVKEAGGKKAWMANVDEQIDDLSHYLNYLKKSAYNEVNRGGNFESADEVDEAIKNCEKQLGLLKSKKQIIEERLDEQLKDFKFIVKCNNGPKELIKVTAEDKAKAEEYAKKMYAQNHTTYADDRHNIWSIEANSNFTVNESMNLKEGWETFYFSDYDDEDVVIVALTDKRFSPIDNKKQRESLRKNNVKILAHYLNGVVVEGKVGDIKNVCEDCHIMNPSKILKESLSHTNVESLKEDTQYGVHSFSQSSIIFRGTEEECAEFIADHNLWDDAEIYAMTPDDPYYLKECVEERKDESVNEALYGMNQIEQFVKMADAIGLKTMDDFKDFMDREGQGKDVLTALYDYLHDEIGDLDFQAKDESLKENLDLDNVEFDNPGQAVRAGLDAVYKLIKSPSNASIRFFISSMAAKYKMTDLELDYLEDFISNVLEGMNEHSMAMKYRNGKLPIRYTENLTDADEAYVERMFDECKTTSDLQDLLFEAINNLSLELGESLKEDLTVAVNDKEVPVDAVDTPVVEPVVVEVDAEKQPIEEIQEKISIEQVLSDLIKDEFEAIDGYSSSLATLKILENDGSDYSGIIANLEDIKNEELVHVGQLQKCLAEVNPKADAIDDGKEEASETIAVAEEESAKGEEPAVEA